MTSRDGTTGSSGERPADLTEREMLRQLFDAMPQLGWTALPDGFIDYYNRGWYEYTGSDYEAMKGWGWKSVHHPDELPRVMESWGRSIATGKPWEIEFPLRRKDGVYRWFLSRATPIYDSSGTLVRWVGINTDIDNQKRAEQKLAELDRAKTTFFSNVSHELRTPLTLLLGPIEDALRSPSQSLSGASLEAAQRNAVRLLKLVSTLLDFSRIEAGRVQASYVETNLAALTRDLASAFESAVTAAGLGFELDCPPVRGPVYVDHDLWEKVVLNLLSNALKFTFHGTIAVQSELGRGSTFTVRIPLGKDHLPAERIGARSTLAPTALGAAPYVDEARRWLPDTTSAPSTSNAGIGPAETSIAASDPVAGARVLLADDNADMRDYLRRLLAERWLVETASDGTAALAAARRQRPDLILTDVMMPNLDGFGLLRELRADPGLASVPVVMLSARAGEEARIEGIGSGADDYLVKPFAARELVARVAAQLQIARLRAAALAERDKLYHLFVQSPVPVMLYEGPEHRVQFASPSYCEMAGRSDLVGKTVREAFPDIPPDHPSIATLDRAFATGETVHVEEMRVPLRAPGQDALEDRWFNYVVRPLQDGTGNVTGLMVVAIDVTAQVVARRAVEALRLEAEVANQTKDDFLAMLGHELRNPLAPILTALQLMHLRGGGGASTREIGIIERQAQHLVRLVDDLLDVSRIARGKIELNRQSVETAAIVSAAIETASPLIETGGHTLIAAIPKHGLMVDVDHGAGHGQPLDERGEVHAARGSHHGLGAARRRRGGPARSGRRDRHRARALAEGVRSVRPGAAELGPIPGRPRSRPRDRQEPRDGTRRHGDRREWRRRGGQHVHGPLAGARRAKRGGRAVFPSARPRYETTSRPDCGRQPGCRGHARRSPGDVRLRDRGGARRTGGPAPGGGLPPAHGAARHRPSGHGRLRARQPPRRAKPRRGHAHGHHRLRPSLRPATLPGSRLSRAPDQARRPRDAGKAPGGDRCKTARRGVMAAPFRRHRDVAAR